jgi:hypothetical protein
MATTRTLWLSFADPARPTGEQFLGVVVVDVSEDDAARALALKPDMEPTHGPWIAAALRAAWAEHVNPGGEVQSADVTGGPPDLLAKIPRLTLLSKADLEALGVV